MQPDSETGAQSFAQQRVAAALACLSALVLQTSRLRFAAPASMDWLAMVLLDQLVKLCEAQQRAFFFLPTIPEVIVQETVLPPPSLIAIRVRDSGIGIEPAHLALISRRFYRVDTRLTREVNGLGLGLALCKAIIALHRGMLRVESAVGEGSTFSPILPHGMAPGMDERVETEQSKERLEPHL